MVTGQVGAQLKPLVSAVPPGSGQGAHDPGNEQQTRVDGPESQECSMPVDSNGKGAPQLPGVLGHKPTSKEREMEVRPGHFLRVARSSKSGLPHSSSLKDLPFKHCAHCPVASQDTGNLTRGVQEK